MIYQRRVLLRPSAFGICSNTREKKGIFVNRLPFVISTTAILMQPAPQLISAIAKAPPKFGPRNAAS